MKTLYEGFVNIYECERERNGKVETYTKIKNNEEIVDYCLVHPICIKEMEEK